MKKITPIAQRFWNKVSKTTTCWRWTGTTSGPMKYGWIGAGRRGEGFFYTHRLSWMIHYGFIPEGLDVLHKCDNPLCVNPDHLFLGTQKDNMQDMMSKGRRPSTRGENSHRTVLTDAQVIEIRNKYKPYRIKRRHLAAEYGVTQSIIDGIVFKETWKHLLPAEIR